MKKQCRNTNTNKNVLISQQQQHVGVVLKFPFIAFCWHIQPTLFWYWLWLACTTSVLGTKGYRARYKRKQAVIKSAIGFIALFAVQLHQSSYRNLWPYRGNSVPGMEGVGWPWICVCSKRWMWALKQLNLTNPGDCVMRLTDKSVSWTPRRLTNGQLSIYDEVSGASRNFWFPRKKRCPFIINWLFFLLIQRWWFWWEPGFSKTV